MSISRRAAIKRGAAALAAGAAAPVALAGLVTDAEAQGTTSVAGSLNFLLTLEYLESAFYTAGLAGAVGSTLSAAERNAVEQASKHEAAHVAYLRTVIATAGGTAVALPTFDFTAGNGSNAGPFADVFQSRTTFLALAQAFEDLGVRAYKGQLEALAPSASALQAALRIHTVEGRHAAQFRRLRGDKGWISTNDRGALSPILQPVYLGEENVTERGIDATAFANNVGGYTAVTEAFDEPLSMSEVLAALDLFIV